MANLASSFNQRLEEFFRSAAATEWISDKAGLLGEIDAFNQAKEDKSDRAYEAFHTIVDALLSSSYTTEAKAKNVSGGLAAMEKVLSDKLQFMFAAHNLSEAIKAVVGNLPSPLPAPAPAPVAEPQTPAPVAEPQAPAPVAEPQAPAPVAEEPPAPAPAAG